MAVGVQNWITLISTVVAALALLITLVRGMKSDAREDGKTAEILRQVDAKLASITKQQESSSARLEAIVERVVAVEQSTKQAHHRIDELRDELHTK